MGKSIKEPIHLRQKKLRNGNISLYLDIYHKGGSREYEFLKLYLIPEKTKADKERNENTIRLAEAIKARRIVEIQNDDNGFKSDYKEETSFFEFYQLLTDERKNANTSKNYKAWMSALYHLKRYERNEKIKFSDITPKWVQGFKDFLNKEIGVQTKQPLKENTKHNYFVKLAVCFHEAIKRRIIRDNPMVGIKGFKAEQGERMYLTIDEVKKLSETPCKDYIKKPFLFSCLTGLRRSDIIRLRWMDVQKQGEFTRIIFRQKKTHGQEYMDIAPQAVPLMGERGNLTDFIFKMPDEVNTNRIIKRWVKKAGISKNITFHSARHTFATMMLDIGTDLYTVSKLLGHRKISTTQIYAKVLDKNKQKAVLNIPLLLCGDNKKDE